TIDVPGGEITGMAVGDYEIDIESRPEGAASTVLFVHGGRARIAGLMSSVANPGFLAERPSTAPPSELAAPPASARAMPERPETFDPRRALDVPKGQSALLRSNDG